MSWVLLRLLATICTHSGALVENAYFLFYTNSASTPLIPLPPLPLRSLPAERVEAERGTLWLAWLGLRVHFERFWWLWDFCRRGPRTQRQPRRVHLARRPPAVQIAEDGPRPGAFLALHLEVVDTMVLTLPEPGELLCPGGGRELACASGEDEESRGRRTLVLPSRKLCWFWKINLGRAGANVFRLVGGSLAGNQQGLGVHGQHLKPRRACRLGILGYPEITEIVLVGALRTFFILCAV